MVGNYRFFIWNGKPFVLISIYLQRNIPPRIKQEPLDVRIGTDIDKNKLEETFKTCGFKKITIFENLPHDEMKLELKKTLFTFTKYEGCLIVCILSHGDEGNWFTYLILQVLIVIACPVIWI